MYMYPKSFLQRGKKNIHPNLKPLKAQVLQKRLPYPPYSPIRVRQLSLAKKTGYYSSKATLRRNGSLQGNQKVSKNAVAVFLSKEEQECKASNEAERVRQETVSHDPTKKKGKKKIAPKKSSTGASSCNAHQPFHPIVASLSNAIHSKSLALQALLTRLTATNRLPPHSAISSSSLLLLGRVRRRALGTHGPRTSDAAAGTADVDHACRSQLRGGRRLGRGELWLSWLVMFRLCLVWVGDD